MAVMTYIRFLRHTGPPYAKSSTTIERSTIASPRPNETPIQLAALNFETVLSRVYDLNTKTTQSSGPENIGPQKPLPAHLALQWALSLTYVTPENNREIRLQPDRENVFARASGGAV